MAGCGCFTELGEGSIAVGLVRGWEVMKKIDEKRAVPGGGSSSAVIR